MSDEKGCRWNEKVIHSVKLLPHRLCMNGMVSDTPTGLGYHLEDMWHIFILILHLNKGSIKSNHSQGKARDMGRRILLYSPK